MARPIPQEQEAAIRAYAERHGRYWKAALRQAWMTGNYEADDDLERHLVALRNQQGPSWLVRLNLGDLPLTGRA